MASAFLQKVTSLPKVVTVTGAASGIGLATAKSLAQLGCAVSLADINLDKLEEAASAIKAETPDARLLITALDIRDRPAVARWIADTEEKLGTLSGSFNAAGAATASHGVRPLLETPDEEWDDTIGINLTGTMNCVKQQVRAMKASQTRGGSIVVVASVGGLVGTENGAAYSAAKFGTVGLIRSAARETASFGIRIVGIAP
jgi:NAD(P)-dependent dehydrogenase (short-subunit alcohol dehydrogenase family)